MNNPKIGFKPIPMAIALALAAIIYFIPTSDGVTDQAWSLLALFVGVIAAIIGKALSVDGPARQRYPVQAVAGHKGQPRFRDQQMIQLFGGEGTGAADDMVPPCHCFIP